MATAKEEENTTRNAQALYVTRLQAFRWYKKKRSAMSAKHFQSTFWNNVEIQSNPDNWNLQGK